MRRRASGLPDVDDLVAAIAEHGAIIAGNFDDHLAGVANEWR